MSSLSATNVQVLSGMGNRGGGKESPAITFRYTASNAPAHCQQGVTIQCTRLSNGTTTAMDSTGTRERVGNNDISCDSSPATLTPGTTVSLTFEAEDNDSDKKCFSGTETYRISLRSIADTNKLSSSQTVTVNFKNNCYPEQVSNESLDAFDQMGSAVAVDGATAAVLAPGDDSSGNSTQTLGAVYIYQRTNANTWTRSQILRTDETSIVSDRGAAGDSPGALALKGDVLAIGSEFNGNNLGAVYVFKRSSGSFSLAMKLAGSVSGGKFGKSVALDSTKLAVGAPGENTSAGSVYVFDHRNFSLIAKVSSPLGANGYFGAAVAIENSLLAVGAPGSTLFRDTVTGDLLLFQQSGSSFAELSHVLRTNANKTNIAIRNQSGNNGTLTMPLGSELGHSLAIYQGAVIVGAPGYRSNNSKPGIALILSADRATLQTLTEAGNSDGARFGTGVALSSAGAFVTSPEVRSRGGAVDHFAMNSGAYRFVRRIVSWSGADGDQFGSSVAASGNHFVVGARVNAAPLNANGSASFLTTVIP